MFKKVKRMMAFLLTLVVVASLVYQDGYRALAQELVPQEQAEAQALSEEIPDEPEAQEPVPQEPSDQPVTAEPTPGTEDSGTGTEENVSETDIPDANAPEADAGTEENVSQTPAPTEEPEAESAGDQDAGAQQEQTPTGTPTAAPTEVPEETPTATPEPTQEPTGAPEEVVLTEQTLSVSTGDATVTLQGVMPENATVQAIPVQVEIEGQEVLAAYDITIYDAKGQVYQPQEGAIKVDITNAAVAEARASQEEVSVYHMEDAASAPQEVAAAPEGNGVSFQAESFSIYVVTKDPHYTATYNFYAEEEAEPVNTQILSAEEKLNRPETPENTQNQKFIGWFYENGNEFEDSNFGKTAGELNGTLSGSITINLYAHYETVYYVYYMSGNDEGSHVLYTQTYENGAAVDWKDVPFKTSDVNMALVGWSQNPDAENPDAGLIVNGRDITLYPVVKAAHWITYDSQGGSVVDPAYVLAGGTTQEPSRPIRTGYDFTGWYTEPECKNEFRFGEELTENITLYAGWRAAETTYTVIYWKQKVTDDKNAPDNQKTYDYGGRTTRQATTGATVGATREDQSQNYTGFHYNSAKQLRITVAADGSSILNVYYDRDLITLNFYVEGGNWWNPHYELSDTMTGLYGSTLEANGYTWPSESNWSYDSGWGQTTTQTYMDAFIPPTEVRGNTVDFKETDKGSVEIRHYVESLDGSWELKAETTGSNNSTFTFSNKFNGFTVSEYRIYEEGHWEWKDWNRVWVEGGWTDWKQCSPDDKISDYSGGLEVRHKRNLYTLDYVSQNETIESERIKYEAPLESYEDFTPEHPENLPDYYHFGGWYKDPDCTEKFDFSGTMLANNLVVYAKWTPEPITVYFDTDGGTDIPNQIIDAGTTATKPDDPEKEGYTFAGWTRNGEPFNFSTQLIEDTTLTAQWISDESYVLRFDPGAGQGDAFNASQEYADGATAKLPNASEEWTAPDEKEGFICWNTKKDGTGTDYYPGAEFTISAEDAIEDETGNKVITLYAKWAEGRRTTLTYDYNGGQDKDNSEIKSETVDILTPNEKYQITNDGSNIVREGYTFIGWSTSKDGSSGILKMNAEIQVDTLKPGTNVLYAQWKKAITVTVTKKVDGSMGDRNAEFKFTYTVNGGQLQNASLSNGESFKIDSLKPGDEIIVTEVSGGEDGYTTEYTVKGATTTGNTYKATLGEDDESYEVVFTNTRCVVPPTGLSDNMAPFAAMTLAGLGAAAIFFLPRRRRQ